MPAPDFSTDHWMGDSLSIYYHNSDDAPEEPTLLAVIPINFITQSNLDWSYVDDVLECVTGHTFTTPLTYECRQRGLLINRDTHPVAGGFIVHVQSTTPPTLGSIPPTTRFLGYEGSEVSSSTTGNAPTEDSETIHDRNARAKNEVLARDGGRCIVSGAKTSLVVVAHLAPRSKPKLYRRLLGREIVNVDAANFIVLMLADIHTWYDSFELSLYPAQVNDGRGGDGAREGDGAHGDQYWLVHFFLPPDDDPGNLITTGYRALHGRKVILPKGKWAPSSELVRWHYRETVRMRFAPRDSWPIRAPRGTPKKSATTTPKGTPVDGPKTGHSSPSSTPRRTRLRGQSNANDESPTLKKAREEDGP